MVALLKSPGGGLAAARQGRVAGTEEGRLRTAASERGAKLAGALCLFVSFFCCGPHLPSPPRPGPRCFYENGKGAAELLGALGRCRELEDAADWVDVFLKAESPQLPFQTTHGCR